MRLHKKYKSLATLQLFKPVLLKRVASFKRPKWLKLKQLINLMPGSKPGYNDTSISKVVYKNWSKPSLNYKQGIFLKRSLSALYDYTIPVSFFKNELKKKNFISFYIKPFFKLDILLWKLNFFSSTYETRQNIRSNRIHVNNKVKSINYIVKEGDLITFIDLALINNNLKKKIIPEFFYNFFEIDYYSQTIIVLKNFNLLTSEDLKSFNLEYPDFKPFLNYLKKV